MANIIEKWLEEYLDSGKGKLYKGDGFEFIIYKGFKILMDEEQIQIKDVRKNDFYTEVDPGDFSTLTHLGFVKGCDVIVYNRDCRRVAYYQHKLGQKVNEREEVRSQRATMDPRKYLVRLDSVQKSITDFKDKLFFFEVRKTQIENKYNLKDE